MNVHTPDVNTAINIIRDWVAIGENQRAGLPVDPEAVEALIARSKDYIENA